MHAAQCINYSYSYSYSYGHIALLQRSASLYPSASQRLDRLSLDFYFSITLTKNKKLIFESLYFTITSQILNRF